MSISFKFSEIYPFGKRSIMAIDFNQQFIDLFSYLKTTILNGDFGGFFYSFTKSIGGNMIGIWSYYLNSPLNIFYLILPLSKFNLANYLIIIIRYGLMALTFSHYLIKRREALNYNRILILIVSLAYALNGYSVSYQVVPIFYDALWLLPLVLIYLEELLDGKNPIKYVLILSFTIFVQYYLGFMISLFIIIYSLFYQFSKKEGEKWSDFLKTVLLKEINLALYSILSIGLISFTFLPNLYNLMFSKGTTIGRLKFEFKFQINPIDILAKFYIGAFDGNSWPAGPNLPNIYVGALALIGLYLYFNSKKIKPIEKVAAAFTFFIFFISVANEFCSKLWHMGQNPAGFFYRFSWLISFYILLLAYLALREVDKITIIHVLNWIGILLIVTPIIASRQLSILTNEKILISILITLTIIMLYYLKENRFKWPLILLVTMVEFTTNAFLTHKAYNFNSAPRFDNAVEVIKESIYLIRPPKDDFYRISKTFTRSKNDPMMVDYPGLTHFSSNIEKDIRDFMDNLGNSSVDATNYYYGTPLTDALFTVKYIVGVKQYKAPSKELEEKVYYFPEEVTRLDLIDNTKLVSSTERFNTYKIDNILPIAFGVNDKLVNINLFEDKPVFNQNNIAKALGDENIEYFEEVIPRKIELVDIEMENKDIRKYKAREGFEGKVIYKFTPTTDELYYMEVPKNLSDYKNEVNISVNGSSYKYRKKFTNTQLFNVAYKAKGKEQAIEFKLTKKEWTDFTNVKFYKLKEDAIKKIVEDKKEQGIKVTNWSSNRVEGEVNITDNSNYLYTSIMYDPGWTVKIDGKKVEAIKIWNSLMAIPITSGSHKVSLVYYSKWFFPGLFVSFFSLLVLIYLNYRLNKNIPGKKVLNKKIKNTIKLV